MIRYDGWEAEGFRLDCNAPVWELGDDIYSYPNGDTLPGLMITEPVEDSEGNYLGRTYTMSYPVPPFYDEFFTGADPSDADGSIALHYGACYYNEGMSHTDQLEHDERVECFRAAELLYRHAAGRGNAVACLNLGYVYSYDRCEGNYWRGPLALGAGDGDDGPYPREERAFDCLKVAAEADIAEACYKLGDLYKRGTGCSPDAAEAFRWYARASELAVREDPVILGSIALRLAGCYEEGFGCGQDFARALEWYRKAVAGLEFAVENGETWYGKALAGARAGEKRCAQELAL